MDDLNHQDHDHDGPGDATEDHNPNPQHPDQGHPGQGRPDQGHLGRGGDRTERTERTERLELLPGPPFDHHDDVDGVQDAVLVDVEDQGPPPAEVLDPPAAGRHPQRAAGRHVDTGRPARGVVPAGAQPAAVEMADPAEAAEAADGGPADGDTGAGRAAGRPRGWAGRGPAVLRATKPPKWVRERAGRRYPGSVAVRFLTGRELDGRQRTNATFWSRATKAYAWSDRLPAAWSAWPRAVRLVLRWLGVAALVGVGWLWWRWPAQTQVGLWAAVWCALYAMAWAGTVQLRDRGHRRRWVTPTAIRLVGQLGYPERTPARRYLWVPRNHLTGGQVEVAVPADFCASPDDEPAKRLAAITRTSLAMKDTSESWHLAGRCHFFTVRVRQRLPVPSVVPFTAPEVRDIIAGLAPSAFLLGLGPGGRPVTVDLDTDAPHMVVSAGTGAGKSVALSGLLAQHLARAGTATVLDFKQTSLPAYGLPGVTYCRDIELMHLRLVALAKEAERRSTVAAEWAGSGQPAFTRELIFIEEVNATIYLLNLWWEINRTTVAAEDPDRYGDPRQRKSPAFVGLQQLTYTGRERSMHLVAASQLATVAALGGRTEVREQFGARVLGRCRAQAWKMLAPEVKNPPTASRHRGRMYVLLTGDTAPTETQFLRTSRDELAACARAGHDVPKSPGPRKHRSLGPNPGPVPKSPTPVAAAARTAAAGDRNLVTLKQASTNKGTGLAAMTNHMLEKHRKTDPTFPTPVKQSNARGKPYLYDPEALRLWAANRNPRNIDQEVLT